MPGQKFLSKFPTQSPPSTVTPDPYAARDGRPPIQCTLPWTWFFPIYKVVKVLDGDTIRLILDRGMKDYTEVDARLYGIDCPEVTGATKPAGILARDFTASWISAAQADAKLTPLVECVKWEDKYGRLLVRIWRGDGCELTRDLYANGYAQIMRETK